MTPSIERCDAVIVGAGPAGLLLAVCLVRFGYCIRVIDKRETPTLTGRADGLQPRSLDLLRNMGLKRKIMAHDPARIYEVAFWDPSTQGQGIRRTGHGKACPPSIDARYPFTTALHQGLIEGVFLDDLHEHGVYVQRPWTLSKFENDGTETAYPMRLVLKHAKQDEQQELRSKYLFSAEGARSTIRERLGIKLQYREPVSNVWGVMDGVVRTNFPDLKMKCTIHSDHGSMMIIPRENDLVRLYIQIASSSEPTFDPRHTATAEEVQATAKRILQPYHIEWERVEWYSVYPIGQGIAERYTLDERIFLLGDACHTHSPKAGQGMNTAFHDALNLAFKIHLVESGFAQRSLLKTYESERKMIAESLLEFDAKFASLFSQQVSSMTETSSNLKGNEEEDDSNEFLKVFRENQDFTNGFGIVYKANDLVWSPSHPAQSALFQHERTNVRLGRVMPRANVTRVVDANVVKLEHEIPLNGSFRIFLFVGSASSTKGAVADFATNLEHKDSFYTSYAYRDLAGVSHHERHNPHTRFISICTILAASRASIDMATMLPPLIAQYNHQVYADDIADATISNKGAAAHAKMGFDEQKGGVILVRPDGHVACVVDLVEGSGTVDALNDFFGAVTTKQLGPRREQARF